jgi:hypothetical protein
MKTTLTLLASLFACGAAFAQAPTTRPANEQVVVPQVERRDVKLPRYPSKDIEVGAFAGVYSTENFGANAVYGLRLGYHITEDFFVQANLAQTKVSDENFRQLLPGGGIFPREEEKLTYYNLSAGWNVLPGEICPAPRDARPRLLDRPARSAQEHAQPGAERWLGLVLLIHPCRCTRGDNTCET